MKHNDSVFKGELQFLEDLETEKNPIFPFEHV